MVTTLFTWLLHSAAASTVILVLAAIAVRIWSEPADRVRIIQASFAASLLALVLLALPRFTLVSLEFRSAESQPRIEGSVAAVSATPLARPDALHENPIDEPGRILLASKTPAPRDWYAILTRTIVIAYFAGVSLMISRLALGRLRLSELQRRARPAPPSLNAQLTHLLGRPHPMVRLLLNEEIVVPITWGIWRPVILLPATTTHNPTQLRYALAHEGTHLLRGDNATWGLARLLQCVLYYQPLFWLLRRRLLVSMDQLADAAAAGQGESAPDYAAFLVELARRRLVGEPAPALSMGGRGAMLCQRVELLLSATRPLRERCSRRMSVALATIALALGVLCAGVRLDAQAAVPDEKPAAAINEASEGLTYTGTVLNRVTGKPIAGAKVEVDRRDQRSVEHYLLEKTQLETDADGKFSFTLSPEQLALPGLFVITNAQHPDYTKSDHFYATQNDIRMERAKGTQATWYLTKLWPGEAISGTVVDPKGSPLKNERISGYLRSTIEQEDDLDVWIETTTDSDGRFRVVTPANWEGVLWIQPDRYCYKVLRVRDQRGDLGTLTLRQGADITGRVLDVDGRPIANVEVQAHSRSDGPEVDEFLDKHSISHYIKRNVVTDTNGEFTLISLPEGAYQLRMKNPQEDGYNFFPLPHVFEFSTVKVAPGVELKPLVIQALPHVTVAGRLLDSSGNPRSSNHGFWAGGRFHNQHFAVESDEPGEDGKFSCLVPQGIHDLKLDFVFSSSKANRWRRGPGQPLNRGLVVKLGPVDEDISGLEIVQYKSPIVLVKAVDEDGKATSVGIPSSEYVRPSSESEEISSWTEGGHASFEQQDDGRWRSEGMLPDEPLRITIDKPGYTTEPQEVSLPEGAEKELVFVLTKTPEDEGGKLD
jgi:beta-lactamase regulating signal transducer with metallopeptidase domain/uncharacterized GH25 family protein